MAEAEWRLTPLTPRGSTSRAFKRLRILKSDTRQAARLPYNLGNDVSEAGCRLGKAIYTLE